MKFECGSWKVAKGYGKLNDYFWVTKPQGRDKHKKRPAKIMEFVKFERVRTPFIT